MNQFAIFYLSTLTVLYVPFATAGGNPDKEICKLKEAEYDHNAAALGIDTYNEGKVYLYTHQLKPKETNPRKMPYVVTDGSKKCSDHFPINIYNTIIFENKVEILGNYLGLPQYITITPDEETFKFGQRFFLTDNFTDQHKYPVTGFWQNGKRLEDVTTIKAKEAEGDIPAGVFIVLDSNNKPRILFSTKMFNLPEKYGSKVFIDLRTKRLTQIDIEFEDSVGADQFHEFVSQFFAS